MTPMADWRYWITYSGKIRTESDDENVAMLAAAERHAELIQEVPTVIYLPMVEVEQEGEGE